jgi:hypothetical protein
MFQARLDETGDLGHVRLDGDDGLDAAEAAIIGGDLVVEYDAGAAAVLLEDGDASVIARGLNGEDQQPRGKGPGIGFVSGLDRALDWGPDVESRDVELRYAVMAVPYMSRPMARPQHLAGACPTGACE